MVTIQDAGSSSYLYTSLVHKDSIRLLQLQPNDSSDAPLSGELIEARLNDELEFEALSYAWGEDQCQPRTIFLDGAQFPVSETLSAALHVFRLLRDVAAFPKHCLQEDGEVRIKVGELGRDKGSVSTYDVLQGMSEEGKKAMAFYESLCDVFEQFQFLITPSGRIGLIPLLAELNDVIFLFPGLKTPYVLRQVKDRDDAVVIGPCYVRGIMDGRP